MRRLRVGFFTPVHSLDPQVVQDYGSGQIIEQLYEAPYELDASGVARPRLFSGPLHRRLLGGGQVQMRGVVRAGAQFCDGSPVTAAEVVDSLRRVPSIASFAKIEGEGATVTFTASADDPHLEARLAQRWASVVKRVGDRLLGTGPFMLGEGGTPEHVKLDRNPFARVVPKIEGVEFIVYSRGSGGGSPKALKDAISTGEVDFTTALGRDDVADLRGVRKDFQPGTSTATLSFNTEHEVLREPEIRRAICEAIDRAAVARISYENPHAFAARSVLPPSMWRRTDRVRHDPAGARERFMSSGVRPRRPLRMLVVWGPRPYMSHPEQTARLVANQLADIGLRVEVVMTSDSADYRARSQAGEYDLDLAGWIADTSDPYDFLSALFHSESVPTAEVEAAYANNMSRYRSPRMDAALATYRADATEANLQAAMDIVTEDAPLCPLCYGPNIVVHGWQVHDVVLGPGGTPQLAGVTVDS